MGVLDKWRNMSPDDRFRTKGIIFTCLFLSPVFFYLGVKLVGPDWLDVHFSRTHWLMGADVLVEPVPRPFLLFSLASDPPGWESPWNRIIVLDAEDGSTLGTLTDSRAFYVLGVTPRKVWVQHTPGEVNVKGYSLPDMGHLHDLDDLTAGHREIHGIVRDVEVEGSQGKLHLDCRDGYHYLLDTNTNKLERLPLKHPAPAPSLTYRKCHWEGPGPIHDKRDCAPMKADPDTIWLDRVQVDGKREWAIMRRSPDGKNLWQTPEKDFWGEREKGDPNLSYDLTVMFKNHIYLSAGDGLDFYVACLDANEGSVVWARTFW